MSDNATITGHLSDSDASPKLHALRPSTSACPFGMTLKTSDKLRTQRGPGGVLCNLRSASKKAKNQGNCIEAAEVNQSSYLSRLKASHKN